MCAAGFLIDRHLNSSNVNAATFGNASFFAADGQLHAQLLFVPGLFVNGKTRDVIFGATEFGSMYAWDLGECCGNPTDLQRQAAIRLITGRTCLNT